MQTLRIGSNLKLIEKGMQQLSNNFGNYNKINGHGNVAKTIEKIKTT